LCAAAVVAAGCTDDATGPSEASNSASDAQTPTVTLFDTTISLDADLTLPPMMTFERTCARCHGPRGMFYAVPFEHEGAALRKVVKEMMTGPAGLDPTDPDVDAMLAYHRSMRQDRPFVIVTNPAAFRTGQTRALRGEVDPDAELQLTLGDQTIDDIRRDGSTWYAEVADPGSLTLRAALPDSPPTTLQLPAAE
jgi:hypothetical protein